MLVRAKQTRISEEQKIAFDMPRTMDPMWQITPDTDYVVFSVSCLQRPGVFGRSVVYEIIDDFDRLMPVPACLFEIINSRPSKHWVVNLSEKAFSLELQEFVDNPFLSERILDRDEESLATFSVIREMLEEEESGRAR